MPFVGRFRGTIVFPGWVSDGTTVICPKCEEEMFVRGGPQTDRLRHFVHYPDSRKCSGESEEHRRWKHLVFRALHDLHLPNQESLFFCMEGKLDVSHTPTDPTTRHADVLLRFGAQHDQFGDGIAFEIQHRNEEKDLHAATYDYLVNGYSVLWVTRNTFTNALFDAAKAIAESDADRMFFRERSVSLPEFDEFRQWDFEQLAGLLDGTQSRLPLYAE
ncbi:hypothetical protein ACFQL3_01775 [Natronoarchaeum sp. GCM10025321]|uniref:hypothetical protein n=1 Tax=Natronoarchaeum sp. GCM10025321 TaxID=3252684 RepID=UPI00361B132A